MFALRCGANDDRSDGLEVGACLIKVNEERGVHLIVNEAEHLLPCDFVRRVPSRPVPG